LAARCNVFCRRIFSVLGEICLTVGKICRSYHVLSRT
jgi:hypothetical protein